MPWKKKERRFDKYSVYSCMKIWGKNFKRLDYLDNLTLSKSILINISVKYMTHSSVKHNQVIIHSAIHILEDGKQPLQSLQIFLKSICRLLKISGYLKSTKTMLHTCLVTPKIFWLCCTYLRFFSFVKYLSVLQNSCNFELLLGLLMRNTWVILSGARTSTAWFHIIRVALQLVSKCLVKEDSLQVVYKPVFIRQIRPVHNSRQVLICFWIIYPENRCYA